LGKEEMGEGRKEERKRGREEERRNEGVEVEMRVAAYYFRGDTGSFYGLLEVASTGFTGSSSYIIAG
jgi:hypothetical protein